MNNITYSIIESKNDNSSTDSPTNNGLYPWEDISLNKDNETCISDLNSTNICNELCAREMEYELNYTVKYLNAILEYYGIKKKKLNKKEIISKIVEFEMNVDNQYIVENRKRLFENFIELKNDPFFSKFIVSNLI